VTRLRAFTPAVHGFLETPPRMSTSPPARPNCSPRRSAGPPDAGRTREDDGRPCQAIT
jgi:hypothetical protein